MIEYDVGGVSLTALLSSFIRLRTGLRARVRLGSRLGTIILFTKAEHVPIRFVGLGASLLPRPIRETPIKD